MNSSQKRNKQYIKQFAQFMYQIGIIVASLTGTTSLFANPAVDHIVSGDVAIEQTANTTTINQASDKAIINWKSFNIDSNESTHFNQPAGGITLNRVDPTQGASVIYGKLTSTGQIILVNPGGVFFGSSAYVNVGSLIASTEGITDKDFLNSHYHFSQDSPYSGSIINEGTIIAANHGLIALVGRGVRNNGLIEANLGQVALASGDAVTMSFSGNSLINFIVSDPTLAVGIDPDGKPLPNGVTNIGKIVANGGKILITAKAAQNVLDNAINMQGILQTQSVYHQNGEIILSGDPERGEVYVAGKLDASGITKNQTGGTVNITGYNILLDSPTIVDVSGDMGAGNINIGGNLRGQGILSNANATILAPYTALFADALTSGNGGNIVLWSNDVTRAYGTISAHGGKEKGDGGLVETSSHNFLDVNGLRVNTLASHGKQGVWLLDPLNVQICTGGGCTTTNETVSSGVFTPTAIDATILNTDIEANLATTDVTINTGSTGGETGNINVSANASITWTSNSSLTLTAAGGITLALGANITNTTSSSANVTLTSSAGNFNQANADINILGNLTISGESITLTGTGAIHAGSLFVTATSGTLLGIIVITSGSQTYSGLVTLADIPIISSGHDVTFQDTIDGSGVDLLILNNDNNNNNYTFNAFTNVNNFTILSGPGNTLYLLGTQGAAINWNITGSDSGTITSLSGVTGTTTFLGISNFAASYANSNNFVFSNNATLSGSINGSYGGTTSKTQTIDYSAYTSPVTVALTSVANGSATSSGSTINSFSNINSLIGPGSSSKISLSAVPSLAIVYTSGTTQGTLGGAMSFNGFSITNSTPSQQPNYSTAVSQTTVVSTSTATTTDGSPSSANSPSSTNTATGEPAWVVTGNKIAQNETDMANNANDQYQKKLDETKINSTC